MATQPAFKPDPRGDDARLPEEGEVVRFPARRHGGGGSGGGSGGGHGGERNGPVAPPAARAAFGMWLALAPLLMFFVALVSAYVVRQGLGGAFGAFDVPGILWLNTMLLVASSVTLEIGRRRFLAVPDPAAAPRGLVWATFALGAAFLAGQVVAWMQLTGAGLGVGATPYGSFFYVLSGTHALHLAGGVLALLAAAAWPASGHLAPKHPVILRNTAIYWHFMDAVWVGLFLLLVFWR